MNESQARIVALDTLSERYRRMQLGVDWEEWTPGQFVMVRVPDAAVLIRRPFGIVSLNGGELEICFKVVGPGTRALARCDVGDEVSVIGPLGHGFDIADVAKHVLVAGGYGIAPIMALARRMLEQGRDTTVIYGAKSQRDILYQKELEALGCNVRIMTEDGSAGEKGIVMDPLSAMGVGADHGIYACGPQGMMKAVAQAGMERGAAVQVSLDEYMACGIGVCLGCVCEKTDGTHVRACREGPVFDARDITW